MARFSNFSENIPSWVRSTVCLCGSAGGRGSAPSSSHAPRWRGPYVASPHSKSICIISQPNDANTRRMRQIKGHDCPWGGCEQQCIRRVGTVPKQAFGRSRNNRLGELCAYRCARSIPTSSYKNDARLTSARGWGRAGVCPSLFDGGGRLVTDASSA